MVGYGLTVFEGTKPERFAIRVVGVLHNFMPKQALILIRSDDPRLIHSGIVQGMSGSPIYLDGPGGDRLAGALSYGWQFAKDPIAGVTPIENMLAELRRPRRGRDHTPSSEAANEPPAPPHLADRGNGVGALVPAAVPLAASGFSARALAELGQALEPYLPGAQLLPMATGGAPAPGHAKLDHFEPGSALSVQLARGPDINLVGTGTVTYVEGKELVAFGHPMFNLGEVYLPIATAEVHTFMSALSTSFKFASPLDEVGTLIQDRQSGIVGTLAERAEMVPIEVHLHLEGKSDRDFQVEVVRHRFLTPLLASVVIANSAQSAASDVADATITLRTRLSVRGFSSLELTDHAFATDGLSAKVFGMANGIRAIGELLFNPFAPVHLDHIAVDVTIDYQPHLAEVTDLSLRSEELEPGTRPSLRVTLRPYNGSEYSLSVPIEIPKVLAGQPLKIEVAAGNLVKPDLAAPENLAGLVANLRQGYSARSLVVTLETPDEDLTLRGHVMSALPASVADTLRPSALARHGEPFKRTTRIVVPLAVVAVGKQSLQARVKELSPASGELR